jgi:alpha-tubulin suppressor-like RCC1 family protein
LGDYFNRRIPEKIKGIKNIKSGSLGSYHSFFVNNNGSAFAFGDNKVNN